MRKKKIKKPYKSLNDIYLKESFAKLVPSLPRQNIFEKAIIKIQKDEQPESSHQVDSNTATKIERIISRSKPIATKEGEKSVNQIIQNVLEIDGWAKSASESDIFDRVVKGFELVELNYNNFESLIGIQTNKDNPLRGALQSGSTKSFTLAQILPEAFIGLFANNNVNSAITALNSIWLIEYKPEGQRANIGPGEVALSIISDAVKGVTGDLFFDGLGSIEVKGQGARLGGSGYAHEHTLDELNKILSKTSQELTIKGNILERLKDELKNSLEKLQKDRELKIKAEGDRFSVQANDVKKVIEDLKTAVDLEQIEKSLRQAGLPSTDLKKILNQIKYFINVQQKGYFSARAKTSNYAPSIEAFFNMTDRLSVEQLIDGFIVSRSYKNTNPEEIRNAIEYLGNSDAEIFTIPEKIERTIAAIHLAEYYINQKFNGILFFNTLENKLPNKLVYLPFAGTNFLQALVNSYNFLNQHNASINTSIDKRSVSVGITLNPS